MVRFLRLYRMDEGTYRAGTALPAAPQQLPARLLYERFAGGKFRKFVLRGAFTTSGGNSAGISDNWRKRIRAAKRLLYRALRQRSPMHDCVASSAKRDEVLLGIVPGLATQFPMVNLKMRHRAATLAPPSVAA